MDLRFTPEGNRLSRGGSRLLSRPSAGRHPREADRRRGISPRRTWSAGPISSTRRAGRCRTGPRSMAARAWDPMRQYIFLEELQKTPAPSPAALRRQHGRAGHLHFRATRRRKKQFLPRIANLDDWWCQGFSEPGAGSDLASLKTRAVRRGRPLHRQRPEDLDDRWPNMPTGSSALVRTSTEGKKAGRHLLPADRHEDARHRHSPDPDDRWRARGQRGLPHRREGAGRKLWSARRTRAGTTQNSCSATSAPTSRVSACRSSACGAFANWRPRRCRRGGRCSRIRSSCRNSSRWRSS